MSIVNTLLPQGQTVPSMDGLLILVVEVTLLVLVVREYVIRALLQVEKSREIVLSTDEGKNVDIGDRTAKQAQGMKTPQLKRIE